MSDANDAFGCAAAAGVRVSVIMPAHNAAATVAASVRSVLQQTERAVEVIVVDDCSRDGTADVVASMMEGDARIRLIRLPHNRGAGGARNAAMAAAVGEWVALLDADDCYDPQRLTRLLDLAGRTGADIVSDNLVIRRPGGTVADEVMYSAARIEGVKQLTATEFLVQNTRTGNGKRAGFVFMKTMIRRRFLLDQGIRYDESVLCGEDFVFYMACLVSGAAWWITPEPMYFYSLHAGSVTERVTPEDLRKMSAIEQEMLRGALAGRDAAFAAALRRHKRSLDHWRYTIGFKLALGQRDWAGAFAVAFESRASVQSVARDLVANAVLGVYRRAAAGLRLAPS